MMTPDQAALATNQHYELPPQVFEAFLDRRMKYTCGLYQNGDESLDQAQEAKLRFIARRLHLAGGERMLDVGCGWGSLLLFLATEFGCHVTGMTPAAAQIRYVAERARVEGLDSLVSLMPVSVYDAHVPQRHYDAVTLVGVIEALPDLDAVLYKLARGLRPGGRLYLSAACYRSQSTRLEYAARPGSRNVSEEIFGYGTMRPLSEVLEAIAGAGLSPSGVYHLSGHYRQTITDWQRRIAANRTVIDAHRPGYAQDLLAYLDIANAAWGYTTRHYAVTAVRRRDGETEISA